MRHCQSLSSSARKRVASSVAWKRLASPGDGASGDFGRWPAVGPSRGDWARAQREDGRDVADAQETEESRRGSGRAWERRVWHAARPWNNPPMPMHHTAGSAAALPAARHDGRRERHRARDHRQGRGRRRARRRGRGGRRRACCGARSRPAGSCCRWPCSIIPPTMRACPPGALAVCEPAGLAARTWRRCRSARSTPAPAPPPRAASSRPWRGWARARDARSSPRRSTRRRCRPRASRFPATPRCCRRWPPRRAQPCRRCA